MLNCWNVVNTTKDYVKRLYFVGSMFTLMAIVIGHGLATLFDIGVRIHVCERIMNPVYHHRGDNKDYVIAIPMRGITILT